MEKGDQVKEAGEIWIRMACALFCLLMCDTVGGSEAHADERPNVIFILADDLGYGDLGVTGHPYARTPELDRLAGEGIRFNEAYMSAAWCAPSRAAIMGGIYPAREFNVKRELSLDRPTLTSLLRESGYATAHFGKWHLGGRTADAPTPSQYGIDRALITNGNGPTWSVKEREDPHWREKTTAAYVDMAIAFAKEHRDQPFYMNLWLYPTHSYIDPTEEMLARYADLEVDISDFANPLQQQFLQFVSEHGDLAGAVRAYCADITEMDMEVGRLMEGLKALGLDERTLVIFTSDNGPGPIVGEELANRYVERPSLLNNTGSAGPYRDRKLSLHEGGIRVPLLMRWPGKIPAGLVNDTTIVGGVDFLPTLLALAGPRAEAMDTDGVDFGAALRGGRTFRRKPLFWNDRPGWSALRDGDWKAHLRRGKLSLYNLSSDPSESTDLTELFPEIAAKYRALLEQFEATLPSPNR